MRFFLFVLYDTVARQAMGSVMSYVTEAQAVRGFVDEVGDPKSPFSRHLADFDLMCVGEFEVGSLAVSSCEPRVVITGRSLLATRQPGDSSQLTNRPDAVNYNQISDEIGRSVRAAVGGDSAQLQLPRVM